MDHVIVARGLVKSYRGIRALDGVDLEIPRGSLYGLLGPNGAGKSTFIRIAMGLLRRDSGALEVLGSDPWDGRPEFLSRTGYVPENPSLPDFMSAEQYLRLVADLHGMGRGSRDRISEVLELVGLSHASRRRTGSYSRGMVQRLAIAQAILPDPELLILDEPLTGLDPEARIRFRELFRDLNSSGKTITYSSHVLEEVEKMSTHVALIVRGRIAASGRLEDVRRSMEGPREVLVELYEPLEGVKEALEAVEGVVGVYANDARLKILVDGRADTRAVRRDVARRIHEMGGCVVELRAEEPDLEKIFMELRRSRGQS